MLGDTITLTVAGNAKVLVRINQDGYSSEYLLRETLQNFRAYVRHTTAVRAGKTYDRHNIEFSQTVYAVGAVPETFQRAYLVFENEKSDVAATVTSKSMMDYLLASSAAALTKLANWES